MGWASGSQLAERVYEHIRPWIPPNRRRQVAQYILDQFEGEDADDFDYDTHLWLDAGRDEGGGT
jgi:hypothetical protein